MGSSEKECKLALQKDGLLMMEVEVAEVAESTETGVVERTVVVKQVDTVDVQERAAAAELVELGTVD